MKKYAVITFMFNNYDLLREPLVADGNFDYYCLTDDKQLVSNIWKCIYISELDTDKLTGVQKTYMAKYSFMKYISNSYEYIITIDASIKIMGELTTLMNFMEEKCYDIGISMHPSSKTWAQEYNAWVKTRGLDEKYKEKFKEVATEHGFDVNSETGLIECTIKIYKNTELVNNFIYDVYNILLKEVNFEDKNDQCYLTLVFNSYWNKLKVLFFSRQLYSNSKYFNSFYHKTEQRWIDNSVTSVLYGKNVDITIF
jgi:hypothetical protein